MSIDRTEPKGSASSSPDERDRKGTSCWSCGHTGAWHPFGNAEKCVKTNCFCEGYALIDSPADPESAGESHPRSGYRDADEAASMYPEPEAPPRRPPYAVAYAIEGGAQYEIALPGDATVRAVDGALVITHASAVLALTDVRPWEGA